MRFAIVIEEGPNNLSAYCLDLPGCITTGRTVEEVKRNMREAIELHIRGMIEDGEPIPVSSTLDAYCEMVDVA